MILKSPKFWQKKTPVTYLLLPIAWLYIWVSRLRRSRTRSVKLSRPVVCVGNLVMGGAGKTPTVIALVQILKEMGHNPHILSRGYGAAVKGIKKVDPERHHYLQVGDEPLLLSQFAPTWVCPNRIRAGKEAIKDGATVLIMDDGFQNKAIEKDLNLLVVDSIQGFGNREVFPAGPLREPIAAGLNRADAIFFIGSSKSPSLKSAQRLGVEHAHNAYFVNL
ncbi:MAG: tetraacyldisaccharide 4'-kinase, partial [Alphaproteobacteria bacterium]|nr:tetraacyldisaccharide 4'-kinase [Alphaproteobacteria bacterium]